MSFARSFSPVIGYASIAKKDQGLSKLTHFCQQIPSPIEILAENIVPCAIHRPIWNDLALIEQGSVNTLIVPSLNHIACENISRLLPELKFLKIHGVVLKSLRDGLYSRRHSRAEMIRGFVKNQSERGA